MKLLISGLGGSVFPYLDEKLKTDFELHYVDADEQLSGLYQDLNFHKSPFVRDPAYWDFIKNIIRENGVDFYFPLIDEEIVIAKNEIEGYCDVHVVSPSAEFSELCLDKYQLMQHLKQEGISDVESYTGDIFTGQLATPFFIKPVSGRGSRGIRKIEKMEQLDAYYLLEEAERKDILIQPFLEGTEYTIGVLVNDKNDLIGISSKRIIRKKGITQIAVTENNDLIDALVKNIVAKMKPCGPFNIQLILTPANDLKIFEINPRFSTTSILEIEGGMNPFSSFIRYFKRDYSGELLRPKTDIILHRRWENLFYERA